MHHPKRQLYVLCDIEGASGISPANREAMKHGSDPWREEGRPSWFGSPSPDALAGRFLSP